jgi:hypothetical protein
MGALVIPDEHDTTFGVACRREPPQVRWMFASTRPDEPGSCALPVHKNITKPKTTIKIF